MKGIYIIAIGIKEKLINIYQKKGGGYVNIIRDKAYPQLRPHDIDPPECVQDQCEERKKEREKPVGREKVLLAELVPDLLVSGGVDKTHLFMKPAKDEGHMWESMDMIQ